MDLLAIALPGKQCEPGETWTGSRLLQIPHADQPGGRVETVDITYTFRGVRQRDGRPEAVISIFGHCHELAGRAATGKIKGTGFLDLTYFQISQANVGAVVELQSPQGKVTIKIDSKMERTLGKELLNVRDQLTANDPLDAKRCHFKKHTVEMEAGKPCVISLESLKGAGWFDTFVRVEDMNGKLLMQDDNRGVDVNSLMVFTPPQTGQYRIVATSLQQATGNYLLVVRQ
jgi:hypothetical protein